MSQFKRLEKKFEFVEEKRKKKLNKLEQNIMSFEKFSYEVKTQFCSKVLNKYIIRKYAFEVVCFFFNYKFFF